MQDASAAAIELNIYAVPGSPHTSGREAEKRNVETRQVVEASENSRRGQAGPHFGSFGEAALRLDREDVAAYSSPGLRRRARARTRRLLVLLIAP